jgi:hypothetical protein
MDILSGNGDGAGITVPEHVIPNEVKNQLFITQKQILRSAPKKPRWNSGYASEARRWEFNCTGLRLPA